MAGIRLCRCEVQNDDDWIQVSTDGQTLDAQHAKLTAAGFAQVFADKVSVPSLIELSLPKL
jgi:hypothetical protein